MGTVIRKSLGILRAPKTSLFLCDMQEKFRPNIKYFDEVVANSSRVLKAASLMEVPVMATEQYPKGLGSTVPELGLAEANIKAYPKTCFSMVLPELMAALKDARPEVESVILCGIETHACIQHTTLELIEQGLDVHVVVDCCSSRSLTDRKYALERLRDVGAFLTTSECVILGLAPDAAHPKFRQIQKLVMNSALDTGLL